MTTQPDILDELESNLLNGSEAQRLSALARMTDLFVSGSARYSDEQVALFDDIFTCLVATIESSALSVLAARLAPLHDAPPRLMSRLAGNDNIDVAGPVLGQSDRLNETVLVKTAKTKGQLHLLAISTRKSVSENVTDILVDRGNKTVLRSVTSNPGARFSNDGFDHLIARSVGDDDLASCLGLRADLPREKFLKLLSKASLVVREKLEQSVSHPADELDDIITRVAERIQGRSMFQSHGWSDSRTVISALHAHRRLTEDEVRTFAGAGRFIEVTASLAAFSKLPVEKVEQMMLANPVEASLVLSKVSGFGWPTVNAILHMMNANGQMNPNGQGAAPDIAQCRSNYERLKLATAQQVVRFQQMNQTDAA